MSKMSFLLTTNVEIEEIDNNTFLNVPCNSPTEKQIRMLNAAFREFDLSDFECEMAHYNFHKVLRFSVLRSAFVD